MRVTLAIDDDVLEAAQELARSRDRTLGEILSGLARRGLDPQPRSAVRSGFPVFEVSPGAPPITPELVRDVLDG